MRKEKETLKTKRAQEIKFQKAVSQAAKEGNLENRPSERLGRMVVVLDSTLSENKEFMEVFTTLGVSHQISDSSEPGCVRWRRIMSERTVNDEALIVKNHSLVYENEVLIMLEAQGYVGLVHYSKQV